MSDRHQLEIIRSSRMLLAGLGRVSVITSVIAMSAPYTAALAQSAEVKRPGQDVGSARPVNSLAVNAAPGGDPGDPGDPGGGYATAPAPVAPERFANSPGGVDMRTGHYNYQHVDLSIGDEHGMRLMRGMESGGYTHFERFGGFSHNWDISAEEQRIAVSGANTVNEFDYLVTVFGSRGTTFRSTYNPTSASFKVLSVGGYSSLDFTYHTGGAQQNYARQPDNYSMTAEDGTVIRFRAIANECEAVYRCSYASNVTEPDGTAYALSYDTSNGQVRLRSVESNRGYALLLEYSGTTGPNGEYLISKACLINRAITAMPAIAGANICPSGALSSSYQYSPYTPNGYPYAINQLTSFTDQGGISALIGGRASAIYEAGSSTPFLVNTMTNDVVTRQDFSDGRRFTYSWDSDGNSHEDGKAHPSGGSFVDAAGRSVAVRYGKYRQRARADDPTMVSTPSPELITDQNGRSDQANYCVSYTFSDGSTACLVQQMQSHTDAEGAVTTFTYDGLRNVTQTVRRPKPGSALGTITTSAVYGCTATVCRAKPTSVTDGRGNVTSYTYDSTHGGVLTETLPADAAGLRPVTRTSYGQRYAWVANGGGGFVRASSPVWVVAATKTCRTTATQGDGCAGGAADEVVTTFDYGPDTGAVGNNLWLRGKTVTAGGQTRRTCYGYDSQGNQIWTTQPRAGVASCY